MLEFVVDSLETDSVLLLFYKDSFKLYIHTTTNPLRPYLGIFVFYLVPSFLFFVFSFIICEFVILFFF
jgi:hypothetical protein